MSSSPEQTSPRIPWWYPTLRKLAVLVLVLALIGGVSWLVWYRTHCASGIRRLGGECIGVTDGRFVFTPDLAAVMGKIEQENRRVEQTGEPYVSIAYLVPLPKKGNDDPSLSEVLRHELQGASIAQYRANRTSELGDRPLIRLLVANAGEGSDQWQPVVAQLLDRVDASDRLVAVAGLGESRETTQQAIKALATREMPMIASRAAADDLSDELGFVRMAPVSGDQAAVAVAYLKRNPEVSRALLIQDVNPEDPFSTKLGEAFAAGFPDAAHTLLEPVERYDGSMAGLANRFVQMMANICEQRPDVVFFAGRGGDLEDFVEALPGRPCPDFPVNLVTGGSGARTAIVLAHQIDEDAEAPLKAGLEANVTLRYTSQAHPDAWAAAPESFSSASIRYFQQACADCFKSVFRDESLDDAGAIMGHDAVLTAVKAIRSTVDQSRNLVNEPIATDEVIQQFNGLHDAFAVPGASGWISLDGSGDPINKAIPILELKSDGTVAFIQLSAPRPPPFTPPPDPREG